MDFLMDYGDDVVKMAIVGDAKWKEQVFMFTAKGLRKTAIEYFCPHGPGAGGSVGTSMTAVSVIVFPETLHSSLRPVRDRVPF